MNISRIIKNLTKKEKIIIGAIAAVFVVIVILAIIFLGKDSEDVNTDKQTQEMSQDEETAKENEQEDETVDKEEQNISDADPQEVVTQTNEKQEGAAVDISTVVDANETKEVTHGIDVSKYQGTISWKKVAESGIDFAMVRVGYRTMSSGEIVEDSNARYNLQEAQKNGIKLGAYFFSTATSADEAIEEANWVCDLISQYKITYPVAYNCEGFQNSGSRQCSMTKTERTDVALAFMKRVTERGYGAMFYASKGEMEADAAWETSRISPIYKVWVAQYPSTPYPGTAVSNYSGTHAMWQYTNKGSVPGIATTVDVNVAYFGYDTEKDAQSNETPDEVEADVEALMNFIEVEEQVTAKDKTNLRDKPSQGSDSSVLYTLDNGEIATRTGVSSSGWSRVVLDGKTYYAVSSYLTTDLSYKKPQPEPDDGIETEFTAVSENVTAKDVVNLRTLPSVTHEGSQVVAQLSNGEVAVRTGINNELGWSRVEYNGQVLYCVSSYLKLAE